MRKIIIFSPDARDALYRICMAPSRQEHVGLLLGQDEFVHFVIGLTNLRHEDEGHGFKITQTEIDQVCHMHSDSVILGRFHTHPNAPACPSNSDIRSLPPDWCEVIVRLTGRWQAPQVAQFHAYYRADEAVRIVFQERAA